MNQGFYNIRILIVFGCFCLGFTSLAGWFYHLQVNRHQELKEAARSVVTTQRIKISGQQGKIFDRDGNVLATNIHCKDILFDKSKAKKEEYDQIREVLYLELDDIDPETLKARFDNDKQEIVIQRKVDFAKAKQIEKIEIPGVRLVDSVKRYYPKKTLASNIIGLRNVDNIGQMGIEKQFDQYLMGTEGFLQYERSRKNRKLFHEGSIVEKTPFDGKDVYLTIREPLQYILEKELATIVQEHGPKYVYGVMVDPKTGAVMAMAQLPTFNPNKREKMNPDQYRNHLVEDTFEPGSTLKGVSIAIAMDYGVVGLNNIIDCGKGGWYYGGRVLRDAGHSYGRIPVWKVVQKSSNIGTAKIMYELLGEKRFAQGLKRFGIGEKTNIGFPIESRGIYRERKNWDKLSITRFPIGQGISVTAVQLTQAYCALANKGKMMQLHYVDKIMDPINNKVVYEFEPTVKRQAIRARTAMAMTKALKTVVTPEGTARRAMVKGFEVAGKTGTSQKWDNEMKTYESGRYVASFIGYVPADNPAFVLCIVADEPSGKSYYGGTVCGPAFSRISEQSLRYLNINPDSVVTNGSE